MLRLGCLRTLFPTCRTYVPGTLRNRRVSLKALERSADHPTS